MKSAARADILWNANELEKEKSSYSVSDLSIIDDIFKTLDNQPNMINKKKLSLEV